MRATYSKLSHSFLEGHHERSRVVPADRRNAGLQLRVVRLHGGHPRAVLLQIPLRKRTSEVLGGQQTGNQPARHESSSILILFKQSLIRFLGEAHRGIHGFVMDENGNPIEKASLKVKSRDVGFQTTKYGEFWRILLPGIYKLEVYADGYVPQELDFMVVDQHPTLQNITLRAAKVGLRKIGADLLWSKIHILHIKNAQLSFISPKT